VSATLSVSHEAGFYIWCVRKDCTCGQSDKAYLDVVTCACVSVTHVGDEVGECVWHTCAHAGNECNMEGG
jgi:hypothetical protein